MIYVPVTSNNTIPVPLLYSNEYWAPLIADVLARQARGDWWYVIHV